ncbi:hypothetical protein ACHWQZ_G005683 [Mnemiopsis leidyi]
MVAGAIEFTDLSERNKNNDDQVTSDVNIKQGQSLFKSLDSIIQTKWVGPVLYIAGGLVIVGVVAGLVCGLTDSCKSCKPVDGGWTDYGAWSDCSKSCGSGTQYSNRTCSKPVPNSCGSACTGDSSKVQECNVDLCPCDKISIQDGTLNPDQLTYNSGDTFEVVCNTGFSLEDISLKTVTCTDGELSELPSCSPGPCEKPEIENGEVSPTSETVKSGESYEVTCSSGHSLSEPTLSTLTCTNGELSTLPTCEPDPCEKPEIENGEVSPTSETVKSGESYEVTCSSGHSLSEPTLSTLTCTNGELSTLPTCEPDPCPDCAFETWKTNSDQTVFTATKEGCGTILVNSAENSLSIKLTEQSHDEITESFTSSNALLKGLNNDYLTIEWNPAETSRSNETVKLVFSDSGGQHAVGNFDGPLFTNKSPSKFALWVTKENPTYLPFYLSRSSDSEQDISVCMFADAKGAPIEISVSSTSTEWLIYSDEEVKFYFFNGQTVQGALDACLLKWKEIYPDSDSSIDWTDNFIVGSLTPRQIKTDQENSDTPATHYILSPDSVSMGETSLVVENGEEISDYSNVIITINTRQLITADSGIAEQELTPENGFYSSISGANTYILDFDNSYMKSKFDSYLSNTDAGFLLSGGNKLDLAESEDCTKYFYCSDAISYGADICLGADFGQSTKVFERNNFYDVSKRGVLNPQNGAQKLVIDTIASPGSGLFYRTDLELTVDGLKTCYHNLFNLPRLGIGAVTCNMCAGVVPSTDSEKSICFTWSQLSLLMPYVIISSANDLTGALGNNQNVGFSKLRDNMDVRKQLFYYLSNPAISTHAKNNGILLGENVFMVVNLEGSTGDLEAEIPSGQWLAPDPLMQSEGTYKKGDDTLQTISYEENLGKLLFYRLGEIFVLRDKDDENHLEVHIMQTKEDNFGDIISSTFTVDNHVTTIKLEPSNAEVTFTYTAGGSAIDTNRFEVSKLVIYYWSGSAEISTSAQKYDIDQNLSHVVFDYTVGNNAVLNSIFANWTERVTGGGS